MKYIKAIVFVLFILALSCTIYTNSWIPKDGKNLLESKFRGKSIGIIPMDVEFSSSRFVVDLRSASMEINGQKVQLGGKYLTEDESMKFGKFGVLEVNLAKKFGVEEKPFSLLSAKIMKSVLENKTPYKGSWAIGLGIGKGKSGLITNRKLSQNIGTFDQIEFDESIEYPGYFSKVDIINASQAKNYDYVMTGEIDLSNEVIEIIAAPDNQSGSMFMKTEWISRGDYYLTMLANIDWVVKDPGTNEVVAKPGTDFGYKVYFGQSGDYKLPIRNGDAAAYSKWFEDADMNEYIEKALTASIQGFAPIFTPFYVFDVEAVPLEKE